MSLRVWAIAAVFAASCSPADTHFATQVAPGFSPPGHAISVLGLYREGRMSTDGWGAIAPQMAKVFGGAACDAGFSASFADAHADLAAAIDDYTRDSGPTDDVLASLAPAARGDVLLVVTLAGHARVHTKISLPAEAAAANRRSGSRAPRARPTDALDMTAVIFSVRDRRSVASVAFEYTGESAAEAIANFASKLGQTLPGATCAGWDWAAVPRDGADHIRALPRDG
jgi:hypothetical protein